MRLGEQIEGRDPFDRISRLPHMAQIAGEHRWFAGNIGDVARRQDFRDFRSFPSSGSRTRRVEQDEIDLSSRVLRQQFANGAANNGVVAALRRYFYGQIRLAFRISSTADYLFEDAAQAAGK